jgi:hypothetical protein
MPRDDLVCTRRSLRARPSGNGTQSSMVCPVCRTHTQVPARQYDAEQARLRAWREAVGTRHA